jgi:hypothetical protein
MRAPPADEAIGGGKQFGKAGDEAPLGGLWLIVGHDGPPFMAVDVSAARLIWSRARAEAN